MRPKAYSYIRFSSPEQAKGHSYKRQVEKAERYAEKNNLELVTDAAYAFFDSGKSAYTSKNLSPEGELKRFLDLVADGSIPRGSYLLVENLDRLSREKINVALPRFMDLLNNGIRVVTLTDERVYDENYNELDLIISIVQMSRAHDESSNKGYRVSKAWRHKQERARSESEPLGKICPAWLQLENGEYKIIHERVALVQRIFELSNLGWGRIRIAKELNKEGIKPWGISSTGDLRKGRNKSGNWGTSSITKILTSRAVIGEYQPHQSINGTRIPAGEPISDYYPKIIEEELFRATQAAIHQRRVSRTTKQTVDVNVWQKVAFCDRCGAPMHLVNKGTPPKGYKYIVCSNYGKGACDNPMVRYEVAEKVFPEILVRLNSLSLVQANESSILARISEREGELLEIQERVDKQKDIFSVHPSKSIAAIIQEAEASLERVSQEILDLKEKLKASYVINKEDFLESINLENPEQRHKANLLIRRLGLRCYFNSQRGLTEDYPIYLQVHALREEESLENNGLSILVHKKDSDPEFVVMGREYASRAVAQGDIDQSDFDQYFGIYRLCPSESVRGINLLRPNSDPDPFGRLFQLIEGLK